MAANRLKERLVDFCITKWRSDGPLVNTIQEVMSKISQFSFDQEPNGQTLDQEGEFVFLKDSRQYLWVPFNETSPSTDPNIRQKGQELDQYILNNPSVVHSLDALLDEDIRSFGLDSFLDDSKPLTDMNRHEKIQLLARHHLMIRDEPLPPGSSLDELRMAIVRINFEDEVLFEWVKCATSWSYQDFMAWIEKVAEPQQPAVSSWRLHDSIGRELKRREPMTAQEIDEDLKKAEESWRRNARLTTEERMAWSFKLAKTNAGQDQLEKLTEGDWCFFKTPEDFSNLLEAAKDPIIRPIFMRTHLLNEKRGEFSKHGTM